MICHSERIAMLTQRAKKNDCSFRDLEIGETCYLLSLIVQIRSFRMGLITQDELFHSQKELEKQLEKYYQHTEIFDKHINIRNHYSYVLTEAVKSGCPVCRKLVGVFDGLEKEDI